MVSPPDPAILDPAANAGYLDWPLPSTRDTEIGELLATRPAPELGESSGRVLLVFAERMAALAVRDRDPDTLRRGLRAAAVAAEVESDSRGVVLVLPTLWHSAGLLGLDRAAEFTAFADQTGGELVAGFAGRRPEDQTLECMGYVEVDDADGFRYQRTW